MYSDDAKENRKVICEWLVITVQGKYFEKYATPIFCLTMELFDRWLEQHPNPDHDSYSLNFLCCTWLAGKYYHDHFEVYYDADSLDEESGCEFGKERILSTESSLLNFLDFDINPRHNSWIDEISWTSVDKSEQDEKKIRQKFFENDYKEYYAVFR